MKSATSSVEAANQPRSRKKFAAKSVAIQPLSTLQAELQIYNSYCRCVEEPASWSELACVERCYKYWRESKDLNILRLAAQYVFSISASCAEIERLFSISGVINAPRRRKQKPSTLQRLTKLVRNYHHCIGKKFNPLPWAKQLSIDNSDDEYECY